MNQRIIVLIGMIASVVTILPATLSIEQLSFADNSKSMAIVASAFAINSATTSMGGGGIQGSMGGNQNMSSTNKMNNTLGMPMQMMDGTANASIDKVVTYQYANGMFRSLVFVKYEGKLHINHIVINQTNSDVKILKATINHKWIPDVEGNSITLHSNSAFMTHHGNKAMIVIKVLTDAMPAFKLYNVSSHSGT